MSRVVSRRSLPPLALCAITAVALGGRAHAEDPEPVRVPVERKAELQTLLESHGSLRLDANADYRGPLGVLTLSSGQRVVGGWNTRVPRLVIPGGASRIFVSGVRSDGWSAPDVEFSGGASNDDVAIVGGGGGPGTAIRVRIRDGAHVNRLTLSEYGGLDVQQGESGYVRDSVFTRLLGYWPGPQIAWQGNGREPSRGNAFFGLASITPDQGSWWKDAGDLWLVDWNCESWNARDRGSSHCFTIDGATRVVSVGLAGGTSYPQRDGALAVLSRVPTVVSWFQHAKGGSLDGADVWLDQVGTLVAMQNHADSTLRDDSRGAGRARLFDAASPARAPDAAAPAAAAAEQRAVIAAAMRGPPPAASAKPQRRARGAPLGPDWRATLATRPDSSARIQADIDRRGIATLAAGAYYLDRPLKIGSRDRVEGLLGEGSDRVQLVAKGDFPIIEGRGDFGRVKRRGSDDFPVLSLVLEGLALYGGRHGVHWSGEAGNLGPGATVAWSQFRDLTFVGQTAAAVNVAGINGLDSNLWYRVDFFDVPVAFRGDGKGLGAGMNYADKQHFLDCQYQNVADAVWYWTADRPSTSEVWKDNVFFDVGAISRTRGASGLTWVNSVIENVHGDVAIDVLDTGSTTTYYFTMVDSAWRGRGPTVVTDTQSLGVGTLFVGTEFAQAGGSIVSRAPGQSLFAWGSRITGTAEVGAVENGLFVDSRMGPLSGPLTVVENGRVAVLDTDGRADER